MENSSKSIVIKSQISSISIWSSLRRDHYGTHLVAFAVLSERFSFWGLQAVLVLFLMQSLSQTESNAFILVGAFGALSYAFSVLGGYLADKALGIWRACTFGLGLCLLGNGILIFARGLTSVDLGLSCVLVGAGLFSPSSNNLIRMLYDKKPDLKESGFLIICMAGNISGALAPLIYGLFGTKGLWQSAFLFSTVLNGIVLISFFRYSRIFFREAGTYVYEAANSRLGEAITLCLVIISFLFLTYIEHFKFLLTIGMLVVGILFVWFCRKLNSLEKQYIGFVILLTIILLLFYVAVFQIYSSLTLFISQHVNRRLLNWEIPVPAFASLQCVFFILFAPIVERLLAILRKKGFDLSLLMKIPIGLLIGMMGFLFFAGGEWMASQNGNCGMGWLVAGNLCLGLSEVFLYPPILTAVATFSPKRWAGTFMGGFSISLAMSSYFSGYLAKFISQTWNANVSGNASIFCLGYVRIAAGLSAVIIVTAFIFSYLRQWYYTQQTLVNGN